MKQYSDPDIEKFIKDLFSPKTGYRWDELTINIDRRKKELFIRVTKMYESPKCGFTELKKISEFFGTDNIDRYDDISEQGCETCDHGSKYGFALRIWE